MYQSTCSADNCHDPPPHLEDGVEVVAAGAEDDAVRLDRVALGRQGHVREVLVVAENPVSLR